MGRREREVEDSRLRDARRVAGLSLSDFASKVGYSRSYLSAVELGHLPQTEQIVMAYEAALSLERGSLEAGMQSVARVLHRMRVLGVEPRDAGAVEPYKLPLNRLTNITATEWARSVLTLLSESVTTPPGRVVLTSFFARNPFGDSDDLYRQWISCLQDMIDRGWFITHVIGLVDEDSERSLDLVEGLLPLLVEQDHYRPLFLASASSLRVAQESVLVEGLGGLLGLSTLSADRIGAMAVRDAEGMQAILENCEVLIHSAEPLIEPITRDDAGAFGERLARLEAIPGDRYLVRDAISWPDRLESDAGWFGLGASENVAYGNDPSFAGDRMGRFLQNVKRFRHRDIALKSRLEELAQVCLQIQQGMVLSEGMEQFQPQRFIGRVRNSIHALGAWPNYELALLDADEVHLIQAERSDSVVYWLVKGGRELLLESWPRFASSERRHLHLAIHEPSIASAFQEHSKNIWSRITPRNRDREYVRRWLERLIEPLVASGIASPQSPSR